VCISDVSKCIGFSYAMNRARGLPKRGASCESEPASMASMDTKDLVLIIELGVFQE
jgi:hypothetical protein